jgi:N-6 DNA Methylase
MDQGFSRCIKGFQRSSKSFKEKPIKRVEDARRVITPLRVNKAKKVSNGNYLWISNFHSYLGPKGRAGFVMSSQASSAGHGEAEVRRKLVENRRRGRPTITDRCSFAKRSKGRQSDSSVTRKMTPEACSRGRQPPIPRRGVKGQRTRDARAAKPATMIGFKQIEFFDHTGGKEWF